MATKWKYASLSADERIERIRNGDKDVYTSEMARSADVVKARNELGLDTSEQKAWIDQISYNYNLSNAEKMGISADRVNKTGYADMLLTGENTASGKSDGGHGIVNRARGFSTKELAKTLKEKTAETEKSREILAEWLLNNGIDAQSEEGKRFIEQNERELAEKLAAYQKEYRAAVKQRKKELLA